MEEILIFGHKSPDTDTIMSSIVLADYETKKGNKVKAVRLGEINKETQYALHYLGQEEPELIEKVEEGQKVMLVDHNEFGQSVEGIENAKILSVVDHHKISNFVTSEPLYYTAMPVGCTATILYGMYARENMEIEPKIAGLMLSAIISDTLLFKSPTCTKLDVDVAKRLSHIAKIDVDDYGISMLKAGTDLSEFTPEQLINLDSKPGITKGVKYQIAQVNTVDIQEVLKDKEKIEEAIKKFIIENSADIFVFLITDILKSNSQVIAIGPRVDVVEKAFNVNLEYNTAFLPGVVSRKKQVVPFIEKNI